MYTSLIIHDEIYSTRIDVLQRCRTKKILEKLNVVWQIGVSESTRGKEDRALLGWTKYIEYYEDKEVLWLHKIRWIRYHQEALSNLNGSSPHLENQRLLVIVSLNQAGKRGIVTSSRKKTRLQYLIVDSLKSWNKSNSSKIIKEPKVQESKKSILGWFLMYLGSSNSNLKELDSPEEWLYMPVKQLKMMTNIRHYIYGLNSSK